ncbi:uncharacterized protein CLUP02_17678 [Colletotrichum lupini]|uniref:Uncharacterized protein n=1 Tax=Colletotrichum lupini TaxID=145971 RepID=A0A9Q8SF15_9PEZI|nr:uncharacterized protein CLUP02_17678 [Colletotrichum lupini]UQC76167.1 hypothetical protein CLUP02_17678 [Colletotrichum lupini]
MRYMAFELLIEISNHESLVVKIAVQLTSSNPAMHEQLELDWACLNARQITREARFLQCSRTCHITIRLRLAK